MANMEIRYIGMVNEGTTCFANTLLQALFHLPKFRQMVFNAQSQDKSPLFWLKYIFFKMQFTELKITAKKLLDSLEWLDLNGQHQDIDEFFRKLIVQIGMTSADLKIFSLIASSTIKCNKYESTKTNEYVGISLPIKETTNIASAIDSEFGPHTIDE